MYYVAPIFFFFTAGLFDYIMIVEPRPDGSLPGHMLFVFLFAYISSSLTHNIASMAKCQICIFHHCTLVNYLRLFFDFLICIGI